MKMSKKLFIATFFHVLFHFPMISKAFNDDLRKTYIVYMGELPESEISVIDLHHSLLSETIGDESIARKSRIHSYGRSFNGFVARLLPHEAKILQQKEGVISVFPNKVRKLLTTRSWDFLGMPENIKRNHLIESDIIIGLFDSGIWVDSPSFKDEGFGPPPPNWKGKCDKGANFTGCNNKVIGAQFFSLEKAVDQKEATPLDTYGHGTHTASTAAGVSVEGASLYSIAKGTARGGVPSARIASYKVCVEFLCPDTDILAAFDAAIAEGVDVISISISGPSTTFFEDPIAIGSFHALKKGILTVCAAGNDGPSQSTVANVSPWVVTVGASTMDRKVVADLKLGNGKKFSGVGINTVTPKKQWYPLINGAMARNTSNQIADPSTCDGGSLDNNKVKGRIVYCQGINGRYAVDQLGGAGIIMSIPPMDGALSLVSLGTFVSNQQGLTIDEYINKTRSPRGVVYKSRTIKITAPAIASFSSRGPQTLSPQILKPDITAPGVDILAAYSKLTSLTGVDIDKRFVKYNILSGTSMSTPHVSGAAAYVKSFHPNWSAAAIKSALMTTAKSLKIKPVGAGLASGSGQIDPIKALDPGLIYDIETDSYISYLCKHGYMSFDIATLIGNRHFNCSNFKRARGTDGLNYPSMHLFLNTRKSDISAVFYRTVTNVGDEKSVYKAKIRSPKGLSVKVVPKILVFQRLNETRSFKVVLKGRFLKERSWYLSGQLVWRDSRHKVKSPILVYRPSAMQFRRNQ